MRRMRYLKAVVAMVLIAAMLCGSAMAASRDAKVFSPSMKVYNKNRQTIASLSRGTSFTVTKISGNWAKISYGGKTGYAQMKDIVFNKRVKAVSTKETSIKFVTKSSYKKGTYYTGTLAKGVTLYIAGVKGDYYLFYNESGSAMGYVKKSAVRKAG